MVQAFKTAAIGLGSTGCGMAASLLSAGHKTWGDDINVDAVRRLLEAGPDQAVAVFPTGDPAMGEALREPNARQPNGAQVQAIASKFDMEWDG